MNNLKSILNLEGINYEKLISDTGIENKRFEKLKKGSKPYLDEGVKIANHLGVDINWLFKNHQPYDKKKTLKELRKALGLKMLDVVKLTGLTYQIVVFAESGGNTTIKNCRILADFYKVPIDHIW